MEQLVLHNPTLKLSCFFSFTFLLTPSFPASPSSVQVPHTPCFLMPCSSAHKFLLQPFAPAEFHWISSDVISPVKSFLITSLPPASGASFCFISVLFPARLGVPGEQGLCRVPHWSPTLSKGLSETGPRGVPFFGTSKVQNQITGARVQS